MTAIAYCGRGPAPTKYTRSVTLDVDDTKTARVNCPTDTFLVFGGLLAPTSILPFRWTAPSATQWAVTGYMLVGTKATLTAVAYCR